MGKRINKLIDIVVPILALTLAFTLYKMMQFINPFIV